LTRDYTKTTANLEENSAWLNLISTKNPTVKISSFLPIFSNILFSTDINMSEKNNNDNQIYLSLKQTLFDSFITFANINTYTFFEPQEIQNQLIEALTNLFKDWLQSISQIHNTFSYQFLLSGTWLPNNLDFTVQDQLRLNWDNKIWYLIGDGQLPLPKNSIYLYTGGIIDPILKKTILKDATTYYPVGLGFQYNQWNICIGVGIPFNNLKQPSYSLLTIGYEIPFWDIEF